MNHKARNELIEVISGLVMLVAGIFLIVSKTKIVSGFLGGNDTWRNWQRLVALSPLIVGIIMMIIKPKLRVSKIISFVGVMTIIVILFIDTTIIIVKEINGFNSHCWRNCHYIFCPVFKQKKDKKGDMNEKR